MKKKKKILLIILIISLIIVAALICWQFLKKDNSSNNNLTAYLAPWIDIEIGDNKATVLNNEDYDFVAKDVEATTYTCDDVMYLGYSGVVTVEFSGHKVKEIFWYYYHPDESMKNTMLEKAVQLYGKDYKEQSKDGSTHYTWNKTLINGKESTIFISYSESALMWYIY